MVQFPCKAIRHLGRNISSLPLSIQVQQISPSYQFDGNVTLTLRLAFLLLSQLRQRAGDAATGLGLWWKTTKGTR